MAGSRALKSQSVKLIHDDCVNAKAHLGNKKFDLIYLDPPFGTGDVQHLGKHSYSDCYTGEEYLRFMRERLIKVCALLSAGGVILVHLDRHYVYEVKSILDNLGLQFKGDVIWVYRRWASNIDALQGNHDTVLVFSNNANVERKRNVFSNSIVAPSSKERVGYPTQKPLALLKRLIQHFDEMIGVNSILDPFMGSGSTLVAGLDLGKSVCGFDLSRDAVRIVKKRINDNRKSVAIRQLELWA